MGMTRIWDVGCGFALGLVVMFAASGFHWGAALYFVGAVFCWAAPRTFLGCEFQDARNQFQRARVAMRERR